MGAGRHKNARVPRFQVLQKKRHVERRGIADLEIHVPFPLDEPGEFTMQALDRLKAHVTHFRRIMGGDGAVGKKLDFVAQEILRELTTLASKCRHTEVMQKTIDAKTLCEQIREQVQNVE